MKGELPEGWEWKKLGDLIELKYGDGLKGDKRETTGKIPVYGSNGIVGHHNKSLTNGPCLIIGRKGSIGEVHLSLGPCWPIDTTYFVEPTPQLELKFLFYLLKTLRLNSLDRSTAIPGLNRNDVYSKRIPLPPLPVQRQIVAVLEHAEAVKWQRQEADALTGVLLQSVFYEMFGDPVRNERGWDIFLIGNICRGIVPGRNKPKKFGGDIPWINPVDLGSFFVSFSKQNLTIDENEVKRCKNKIIPPKSVIMTCVGDFGITAITKNRVVLNQQLHAFVCTESVNPFYLHFYLKLRMDYFQKMATKTTVNYLNKTKCNSIPVVLPPLALQQQFAHIVESVEALREKQRDSGEEIGGLLEGLLQKAFSGKIVAVEA